MSKHLPKFNVILILLGLVLADCVIYKFRNELTNDRDGYLALAQSELKFQELHDPVTNTHTAYRPPAYPFFLSLICRLTDSPLLAVACLNLFSLAFLYYALLRLHPDSGIPTDHHEKKYFELFRLITILLLIIDPLLLNYSAQPMTEVISSCFVVYIFMYLSNLPFQSAHFKNRKELNNVLNNLFILSLISGISVLVRPTFLIMMVGIFLWIVSGYFTRTFKMLTANGWGLFVVFNICVILFLAPLYIWGSRNKALLNHFVFTTTHGGYTLYLANNEPFYKTVIDQHPFKVWELPDNHPNSQHVWWQNLQQEMEKKGLKDEVSRDQYLGAQAKKFIVENPGRFLKACCYRIFWFWNPVPLTGHTPLPSIILWTIILFYILENLACWSCMILILWRREIFTIWGLCMVMILSYEALHLVYWTNARMRTPVIPLIAILAARFITLMMIKNIKENPALPENNNPLQIPAAP